MEETLLQYLPMLFSASQLPLPSTSPGHQTEPLLSDASCHTLPILSNARLQFPYCIPQSCQLLYKL